MIFHTKDLANLWGIQNSNTLYTTLKRYVRQGLLFRIYKGFYAIKPIGEVDRLLLGIKALHGYAYVSTETILIENGIIQQTLSAVTLVGMATKHFSVGDSRYLSRKLADKFLYQSDGIVTEVNGVRKASVERAVADILYFHRHIYLDGAALVDWEKVKSLQEHVGYPLTPERYTQRI